MGKARRQIIVISSILCICAGFFYITESEGMGDKHFRSEKTRYETAHANSVSKRERLEKQIESGGITIPKEGNGRVVYSEEARKNVITTSDNEVIIQ